MLVVTAVLNSSPPLVLNTTAISISGFNYGVGTGPSAAKSFTVSAQNLIDTLKISLTTSNFEISLSPNDGYVGNTNGPLKIVPVFGVVQPTLIYARLKAGLASSTSSYLSKKVTISSTGAVSVVDTLNASITWFLEYNEYTLGILLALRPC